jgi:hypothetical protein
MIIFPHTGSHLWASIEENRDYVSHNSIDCMIGESMCFQSFKKFHAVANELTATYFSTYQHVLFLLLLLLTSQTTVPTHIRKALCSKVGNIRIFAACGEQFSPCSYRSQKPPPLFFSNQHVFLRLGNLWQCLLSFSVLAKRN